jgi:ribonuclease P protein component
MGDQRLRPSERLRRPSDYQQVFQHGTKLVAPLFVLYVLPTSAPRSRLGMAVSKRVGGAVVRNRVKRRLRELFRRHKSLLCPACDVVFVARQGAAEASLEEYTRQFLMLLHRCQRAGVHQE